MDSVRACQSQCGVPPSNANSTFRGMDSFTQPKALAHPEQLQVHINQDVDLWPGPALELDPGQTDLWITNREHLEPVGALLEEFLQTDERMRAQRLVREEDQRTFRLFRGALRGLLARYMDNTSPGSLSFRYGPQGKPALVSPIPIHFNLAHSGGRLAVAISYQPVGVDIERMDRCTDLDAVAARFYHPAEVAALTAQPADQRRALFFRWWSAKEAALKAWGVGIGSTPDHPDFSRWTEGTSAHIMTPSHGRPWLIHAFPTSSDWAGALATQGTMAGLGVRDATGWWQAT